MKYYNFIIALIFITSSCATPGKNENLPDAVALLSDSTKKASCVSITTDEKDQPIISWCETDTSSGYKHFYMSCFDESSRLFSSRIQVPVESNTKIHEEGMPKIAIKSDGTIFAVYETSAPTKDNRFAGFVRYIVSKDKGKSWTKPAYLHADTAQGKSHSFAAITRLSNGEIGSSWLDENMDDKKFGRPVKFAKTNGSNKFENEMIIDSVACECCRIGISSSNKGKIAIVFRDIVHDSIRDISIVASANNGKTFSSAIAYSNDGWVINGCPHNGPSVAEANGRIYTTWFTGGPQKGIYFGELNSDMNVVKKQKVSKEARFTQLCLLPDGSAVLAFNESRKDANRTYNKIVLNRITADKTYAKDIEASGSSASYPVLKALGTNRLIVAWTQDHKIYYSLINTKSINNTAPTFTGHDIPQTYKSEDILTTNKTHSACGMKPSH